MCSLQGLGPPVWALTFIKGYRPLTFHLPFWAGIAFGVVMQVGGYACMHGKGHALGKVC
jgi:hypothetical protein